MARQLRPPFLTDESGFVRHHRHVPYAGFANVSLIVAGVLAFRHTIFVTRRTVFTSLHQIRLSLRLSIFYRRIRNQARLICRRFTHLARIISMNMVTITNVNRLFRRIFVMIVRAGARNNRKGADFTFVRDRLLRTIRITSTSIRITINNRRSTISTFKSGNLLHRLVHRLST